MPEYTLSKLGCLVFATVKSRFFGQILQYQQFYWDSAQYFPCFDHFTPGPVSRELKIPGNCILHTLKTVQSKYSQLVLFSERGKACSEVEKALNLFDVLRLNKEKYQYSVVVGQLLSISYDDSYSYTKLNVMGENTVQDKENLGC